MIILQIIWVLKYFLLSRLVFLPTTLASLPPGVILLSHSTAPRDSATNIGKTSRKGVPERERPDNGVFTRAACEDAERAAYSQLRLYVTDEYNRQQVGISSQTTEYVARHPVYKHRVHSYSRKLEILSV